MTARQRKAAAKKVRAAADYVDRVGLHKGYYWDEGAARAKGIERPWTQPQKVAKAGLPCCTLGALRAQGVDVLYGDTAPLADRLGVFILERHPRTKVETYETKDGRTAVSVADWNDLPGRRKKDVVELLRAFADRLEQGNA